MLRDILLIVIVPVAGFSAVLITVLCVMDAGWWRKAIGRRRDGRR